ncbi:MAG: tRNA pseudouridine(38-40) synthase TruA [Negativicutes bacterium]|nr:tRNA pseudouridine(38-40) synthase TruA [Negativicutes bacterium]
MERNIKLTLAYDGTAYHGFQRQPNALTIQEVLEEKLAPLFGHRLAIVGSGRTDTGVHAYGQVVSFLTTGTIPVDRIPRAASGLLPNDIVVWYAEEVGPDFHARKSAKAKTYQYRIYNAPLPSPFERNHAWNVQAELDIDSMHQAAQATVGTHDFSSFRAAGGAPVSPVKTMLDAGCRREGRMVIFSFTCTGFLYHMVRNLVGTIVEIGMGRRSLADFMFILAARDRKLAGITAPPQGLYLMEVTY